MEEFIAPSSTLENLDIEYDDFNKYLANINTVRVNLFYIYFSLINKCIIIKVNIKN